MQLYVQNSIYTNNFSILSSRTGTKYCIRSFLRCGRKGFLVVEFSQLIEKGEREGHLKILQRRDDRKCVSPPHAYQSEFLTTDMFYERELGSISAEPVNGLFQTRK